METITLALLLLLAAVLSGVIVRISPIVLSLPLVQIALGALLKFGTGLGVQLEPEVFFLLFLPPLLFLDGWRIPKRGFFRDFGTISALAIGLVVFTVLGMGFFIGWLVPSMPLSVAFALAAVLSPTDPIAVTSIAAKAPIPKRLMHILQGESLLNDASGLVCLRFAIAAALTGTFSLPEALLTFLQLALGGVVVGLVFAVAVGFVQDRLARWTGEDPGSEILISLLLPFGAYLAAERVHGSGILAAVAAGIATNYVEIFGRTLATTRIPRGAVWDTVQLAANGAIFVLLGEQLPSILASAKFAAGPDHPHGRWWLLLYVFTITIGLMLLRLLWVWISLEFVLFRAVRRGLSRRRPDWRMLAVTSLAGTKGAVTLAGILTLPLVMPNGSPFPARELAIFLAMGTILLSLVAATVGVPRLMRGLTLPLHSSQQDEEDAAREAADLAAVRAIQEQVRHMMQGYGDSELYADAATHALEPYRSRRNTRNLDDAGRERSRQLVQAEHHLRTTGLRAAREELYALRRAHRIDDETLRRMVRDIDLAEARYSR